MIKLCKNSKDFKWWGGFGFGIGTGLVISYSYPYPYPTFGYRGKPEPEPIPDQLRYYPSKSLIQAKLNMEMKFEVHKEKRKLD